MLAENGKTYNSIIEETENYQIQRYLTASASTVFVYLTDCAIVKYHSFGQLGVAYTLRHDTAIVHIYARSATGTPQSPPKQPGLWIRKDILRVTLSPNTHKVSPTHAPEI